MNCKFEPQDKWSSRPQNSLYITLYLLNRHGQLGHTFAKYRFWHMTALLNISGPIWLFVLFIRMCRGIFSPWSFLIMDNVSAPPICLEASGWTNCSICRCRRKMQIWMADADNFHNKHLLPKWMSNLDGQREQGANG